MTIDMTFERREELFRKEEREIGYAQGHKKGHSEGHTEGVDYVIKSAIASGRTPEEIASFNGIPLEEVLRHVK